jgi:VanZ family protein
MIVALSGDLGSSQNTSGILAWLLSWLPLLSPEHFDLVHHYVRKGVGHAGSYGFLYFLWFRALRVNLGYRGGRAFLWSLALCLALALLDEGHQTMLASRTGSLWDVALDLSGSSLVALFTAIFWPYRVKPAAGKSFAKPTPGE